ncbi:MAG: chromosome segregation protein SMC [Bacteroidota bacterium]
MRLKTLEIKGFKSFANDTVINFGQDVIGIVGPNGSGKSNIVDAVRWVLGEQKSKELRLEKMTNVIFNGTKKRKQSGLAQVSLTFENTKNLLPTEYHTVKITRILYRSGESEYRLNGVTCRLKDITSLFLDTGIGSNSYAIIALGMVDDLLNDKDNSRRKMFEQAAGISKYKMRKRETLNKLKSTSDDLDRIEDLLFEIDKNLKQLEKQAKRTKRFYELKEQYKELSVELAIYKLGNYKQNYKDINAKLEQEHDAYRQLEIESRQLEAKLENERKTNLDKEKLLSERQRDLNELVGLIRNKESDKNIGLQKVNFNEQNHVKLAEQIKSAKSRTERLNEDIEFYRSQMNTEKRLEADLEDQLVDAEEHLKKVRSSHSNLKSELDEFIQGQQQTEREVFELEKQKAINNNQIQNLSRDIDQGKGAIGERQQEVELIEEKLKALEAEQKQQQDQLEALEKEELQRLDNVAQTEEQIEQARKEIAEVNRKLDARRNEYKLTKSMVDNLEGFPESIKFLSKNKNWAKEASLLSDLIYVKEEYRVAIENYLEPYLNYYVVRNLEEAHNAIKLLGKSQRGKANFFILEAFDDYELPMVMLPNTQRAIDLVETDDVYKKLCHYLLENVVVTDNEDLKQDVGNKQAVLLSKSGRFVQRRFSISGGSVGLFEGKKIGRKKNLEVLDQQIKKLDKQERKLSTRFYTLKEKLDNLRAAVKKRIIDQEREALNKLSQEKVSLMTRLENFENFLRDANEKIGASTELIEAMNKANQDMDGQLNEKRAILEQSMSKISETDDSYRQVAEQLGAASAAFNEKNIEFIRQQNKVQTFQQELSFREKQLEEVTTNLKRDQQAITAGEVELQNLLADIEVLEKDLLKLYEEKQGKEASLTSAEQSYFDARGEITEIEDQLRTYNRKRQDSQLLINNLKDRFNSLKLEFTSIGERLRIEFNITMDEVLDREPTTKLTPEELQTKVDKLKKRLDNYGEINPMAVEAYDEMKVRYDSISTQRDDILEAKKSLLETIKEIEDTATSHFMTAFEKVRTFFIEVFRSLFSEDDSCDLLLEDPENPLDSKIKITAKPKGKRPLSISQLSGGEKTLTATALLFSLYLLKPAPFCIFDEVDAPLDDANIEKFNRIIRKFSEESQFVVVTHNKATMAAVDVIYGVFMQEQGVSNVSAVDFRELEHSSTLETVGD